MKPVVGSFSAYFCTGLSIFGVIILSVIGILFYVGHESMVGSITDPSDGKAVASTIFGAVIVYALFAVFCGWQIHVIKTQDRIRI
ncbi:uncharacterized protein SAPINGB_P000507 [Magnusiomyces paraingens]|uniref:Uncharacterized protein n=1 Tax=Magnusiomyces paraingens TaxID=2606893 RepID=A0A5E8B7A2_9ASCO|nr:uncharacterized protein SAPINGB_P000507 [Saprochaete ingens]VVT44711.1 unnamed protein product [Saprochaete ingens]